MTPHCPVTGSVNGAEGALDRVGIPLELPVLSSHADQTPLLARVIVYSWPLLPTAMTPHCPVTGSVNGAVDVPERVGMLLDLPVVSSHADQTPLLARVIVYSWPLLPTAMTPHCPVTGSVNGSDGAVERLGIPLELPVVSSHADHTPLLARVIVYSWPLLPTAITPHCPVTGSVKGVVDVPERVGMPLALPVLSSHADQTPLLARVIVYRWPLLLMAMTPHCPVTGSVNGVEGAVASVGMPLARPVLSSHADQTPLLARVIVYSSPLLPMAMTPHCPVTGSVNGAVDAPQSVGMLLALPVVSFHADQTPLLARVTV
jgi:hypothetical protein